MRKGVSPVIAVILLLAIAVVGGVGLYFWVGGLTTKVPTPKAPRTIDANALECGSTNTGDDNYNYTIIAIINTSPEGSTAIQTAFDLAIVGGSGDEKLNMSACDNSLDTSEQGTCRIDGFVDGDGELVLYGKTEVGVAGKAISAATVVC